MPGCRHVLASAGVLRRRLSSDAVAAPAARGLSSCSSAAAAAADVARLFEEEIRAPTPRLLRAFLEVQQLRGLTALAPDDSSTATAGLHPLIVPLARGVGSDGEEIVQGVMRMPPSVAMGGDFCWPLVEASVQGTSPVHHYRLLAQDPAMHVNRIAAEADAASDPLGAEISRVLEQERASSGEQGGFIYVPGSAPRLDGEAKAPLKLRAFLLTKIGMFPDLLQLLSAEHLRRGDQTAAAVASARAADCHFGWGTGYWHQAKLMAVCGNSARAREQASAALHCPFSTLLDTVDDGLGPLPLVSDDPGGFNGRVPELQRIGAIAEMRYDDLVESCHKRAQDKKSQEMKQGLSWPAQAAELRAVGLLDTAVVEGVPWPSLLKDSLPRELVEAELPGLASLANVRLSAAQAATASAGTAAASESVAATVVDKLPRQALGEAMADAMPRTTELFERLPGGSLHSAGDEAREGEDLTPDDPVVLRGSLAEKSARWSEYARLCVQGLGPDDSRAVDAVRKAEQFAGAWEGQRALLRAGLSEGDLAAMIFEHFVQRGSDGECQDSVGDGEQHESGLAQAGTGRGLGFARRLRAVLAEADTKLPGVDTAAEQGDDRLQDDKEETEEQLSAAPSQALSHTRSHRKRLAGAYSDQTRTGYVNTFSSYRAQHLGRAGYTDFLLSLGYTDCNDTRWRLECEAIGALESRGPTLEQFRLLYTLHGRNAWEDAHAIWGERYWEDCVADSR